MSPPRQGPPAPILADLGDGAVGEKVWKRLSPGKGPLPPKQGPPALIQQTIGDGEKGVQTLVMAPSVSRARKRPSQARGGCGGRSTCISTAGGGHYKVIIGSL